MAPAPQVQVKYADSPLLLAQFPPTGDSAVPRFDAETASVVLPPGTPNCTSGSIVLGTGKNDRYASSTALDCLGQATCFSTAEQGAVVPAGTIDLPTAAGTGTSCAGIPTAPAAAYVDGYSDHQVVRTTAAGELIRVVLGFGISVPMAPPCNTPAGRNLFFVDTSPDCGVTWTSRALIDSDPGYDRQELYRDPWDGRLYLTAAGSQGHELLVSADGGMSWSGPAVIDINAGGDRPIVTTSFPAGTAPNPRIVLFTCLGATPSLFWSDDLGTSFSSVSLLDFNAGLPQCAILPDAAFSPPMWNALSVSIGRAGYTTVADVVHVLYPTVTAAGAGNRQDAVLANVRITRGAQNTATVLMIQQLVGDGGASVYRPRLIDADRWDYQPDETAGDANVALIDWYEVTPPAAGSASSTAQMRFRGEVVRGGAGVSAPFDLAVTGGAAKQWTPAPLTSVTNFYGHYDNGSFFMQNGMFNFLAHWTESNAAVSVDNGYVYGNVVQVKQ
ncbi:MAG TPA: hypothetical protein VN999_05355 [Thermoanaerobaculia bacterium]|nr:hypothetical protein [Thermoanaerobaculia bacterium]